MKKINEIFYSLQGEGHHTGYPSIFIRFSGCNLQCPFCDTAHENGIFMSDDDILRAVQLYSADWIVLTGGEPSLYIDDDFIRLLKRVTGKKIAIETNGTREVPDSLDWVTVSPKTGICGKSPEGGGSKVDHVAEIKVRHADEIKVGRADVKVRHADVKVRHADEIKVVDLGQDLDPYFQLPCRGERTLMYLQPCYVADPVEFRNNRLRAVRRVLADPRWTLSVQMHRYLDIP